ALLLSAFEVSPQAGLSRLYPDAHRLQQRSLTGSPIPRLLCKPRQKSPRHHFSGDKTHEMQFPTHTPPAERRSPGTMLHSLSGIPFSVPAWDTAPDSCGAFPAVHTTFSEVPSSGLPAVRSSVYLPLSASFPFSRCAGLSG